MSNVVPVEAFNYIMIITIIGTVYTLWRLGRYFNREERFNIVNPIIALASAYFNYMLSTVAINGDLVKNTGEMWVMTNGWLSTGLLAAAVIAFIVFAANIVLFIMGMSNKIEAN